jgi:hypothetical protein
MGEQGNDYRACSGRSQTCCDEHSILWVCLHARLQVARQQEPLRKRTPPRVSCATTAHLPEVKGRALVYRVAPYLYQGGTRTLAGEASGTLEQPGEDDGEADRQRAGKQRQAEPKAVAHGHREPDEQAHGEQEQRREPGAGPAQRIPLERRAVRPEELEERAHPDTVERGATRHQKL